MKLSMIAPLALALLVAMLASEAAAEDRRLGSVAEFFSGIIASLSSISISTDALSALSRFDGRGFLDAITLQYTGKKYFNNNRALEEENFVIDTPALLAMHPVNDVITRPGVSNLDEWLLDQKWNTLKSDVGRHEQRDQDNVDLAYVKATGAGKSGFAAVLAVGNSEYCLKYSEIIYDLTEEFSPVFCLDHRGAGMSTRLIADAFKNHVEISTDYVTDFTKFVNLVKEDVKGKNLHLIGHSMGGAIALDFLISEYSAGRPTTFHAAAFNAPLIKADTSPFPYPIAVAIGATMQFLGLETSYAPTKEGTFASNYGNHNFESATSQSVLRWTKSRDRCVAYKDQSVGKDNHAGICLGGVTGGKAKEFFDLNDSFEAFMAGVGKISTPILIQMAGNKTGSDGLVLNPETQRFCDEALANCKVTHYSESRHNIWFEKDTIRNPALKEAITFLKSNSGSKTSQCPRPHTCGSWNYSWWSWGCKYPSSCSYQYQFGDYHLGMSCRPKPISC